jgi:hypothetical protein
MSASFPDAQITPEADTAPTPSEEIGKVVQLPLDEAARRRQEVLRVNQDLRKQLALLSHHYAEDAVRMHDALLIATSDVKRAKREIQHQRGYSAGIEAELYAARGDIQFIRERLSQERRRAARLTEIARLPWWAFARRRWSLAAVAADEAN